MRLYRNISVYEARDLFKSVSQVSEYVDLVLTFTQYLLMWNGNSNKNIVPFICLDQDGTNRAYIVGQDKIVSFAYDMNPKIVTTDASPYLILKTKHGHELSHKELSDMKVLAQEMGKKKSDYLYVANEIDDEENPLDEDSYRIFEHILLTEPSYLRFDHDTEHQDTVEHPTNHIDVNFSSDYSYKIGLEKQINLDELVDILSKKTRCRILK